MLRSPRILAQQLRNGKQLGRTVGAAAATTTTTTTTTCTSTTTTTTPTTTITTTTFRGLAGTATMVKRPPRKEDFNPALQKIIENFPDVPMKVEPQGSEYSSPVTSAHMVEGNQVSTLDSAALSPDGLVVHGRYGVLPEPAASAIPLEYLALLRPASEGLAAYRMLTEQTTKGTKGTVLVYGASSVSGLACAQMANAEGQTVVAIVAGNHSGNDDMMFSVKHMLNEPGTAVPQEVALTKSFFRDLVKGISTGDEGFADADADSYLEDFKGLLKEYTEAFPSTRPAAVPAEAMEFNYLEKDREQWDANMGTFLEENFAPGAPPIDSAKLDAYFSPEQYEIFRQKFWQQNTLQISGVDIKEMNPPETVQELIKTPEDSALAMEHSTGYPYCFSIFHKSHPEGTRVQAGGPVLGAVICVTPELVKAANAVAAASTLRGKAEALQFLNKTERQTYLSVCSVIQQAQGAPVVVVGGSLPDLKTVEATDADVQQALSALDIDDKGNTLLNFFVQSYRANDFPFYADYAVFRANEPLAGPRELIVLK